MAGISFIGSYSGIDRSMIDQLMEAEKMPLVQLSNKKTTITEKQNAWKDINTRLNSLFEKLKVLQNPDTFTARKATSTNEDIVTMTTSKHAAEGIYRINVEQLATNSTIIGGDIQIPINEETGKRDITKAMNIEGSFIIKNQENIDGVGTKINIEKDDSLKAIVDKINDAAKDQKDETGKVIKGTGTGITATIIDGRIVLTDEKTGARNIYLDDGENGVLSQLGLAKISAEDYEGKDLKVEIGPDDNKITINKGQQSIFTINGVKVTRDSNKVSDVIDGVTINLNKAHKSTDEYDTITVGMDTEKVTKAVQDFVDQYNSTMKFIEEKMAAGDPEIPGSKGTLSGDGSLMRLHSSLRRLITSKQGNANTDIKDISQIGVSTIDKFGELKFDSKKFTEALSENPENVINFFHSKTEEGKEVGFVANVNEYIDSFISKKNGIIKSKTESYDKTLKDLNRQIEIFNDRMERKEQHYIKMFTALDVAMMQAEGQMSWLQSQIDSMNSMSGMRKK